jgi:acetoacetyl-CoA synthetase
MNMVTNNERGPEAAGRVAIYAPSSAEIARTRLTAFIRYCEASTGQSFGDYPSFDAFSVGQAGRFWTAFLEWSGFLCEGESTPAVTSTDCEAARFFPGLRLNYAENLLRLDCAGMDASRPALRFVATHGTTKRWTRGELRREVEALSVALAGLGFGPGDRVALIAYNTGEAVIAALAASAVGCVISTLAPELGIDALLTRLQRIEPVLLFTDLSGSFGSHREQLRSRVTTLVGVLPSVRALVVLDSDAVPATATVPVLRAAQLIAANSERTGSWPRLPFDHPLFILFTSGTTGVPKALVHGAGGTLLEHAKEHRLHCDLGTTDTLFFHTSIAWMMWNWQLSALASGVELVLYGGPVASADVLWRIVSEEQVTAFGTSPGYLQICERSSAAVTAGLDFALLRSVMSTGSILSPRQQDWVSQHVKRLPIQSISGGTDIIGCFVLGNPNVAAYSAECQSRSLGLDVRALAPDGTRANGIGELVCANPFPSRPIGLLHDPDGTLFHETYFSQNPGCWTHGDLIEFTAEGSARMHGRSDGILNVRGVRVGPAEIYRILEHVPEITDAMAVDQAAPGEIGGSRLVLLVVLRDGAALDERLLSVIRHELAERGSAAHVPAVVLAVPELPVTYGGKRSERSARDVLNGRPAANSEALRNPQCLAPLRAFVERTSSTAAGGDSPMAPPGARELTIVQMTALWEAVLDRRPMGADDNFFDVGGVSLDAMKLFSQIERLTGRELPLTAIIDSPTIRELTQVANAATPRSSPLPMLLRLGDTSMPLFIVHGFGGSVIELRPLARALSTEAAVYGIRASGFEPGEPVYDRVEDMARIYLEAIKVLQPHGPYLLAGYSLGGLVAYEIARSLVGEDRVALLALLDSTVHERRWPRAAWLEHFRRRLAHHLGALRGQRPSAIAAGIGRSIRAMVERLRVASEAAAPADPGGQRLPESVRRLRAAGLAAFSAYRPCASDLPMTVLRSDLRESTLCDPRRVWEPLSPSLTLIDVPGNHVTMIRPPFLATLAERLSACVDAARAKGAGRF